MPEHFRRRHCRASALHLHGRMAAAVIGFAGVVLSSKASNSPTTISRGSTAEMVAERDARPQVPDVHIDGERTRQGANVELTLDSRRNTRRRASRPPRRRDSC